MANITNVKVEKVDEKWATDPSFNVSLSDCYMIAEYVVGINGENVGINVEYYSGKGRIIAVDKRVLCTAEVKDNAISLAFDGDADLNVQLQAKIWYDDDTTDIRCSLTVNGVEDGFCSREESQRVADDWILSQRSLPKRHSKIMKMVLQQCSTIKSFGMGFSWRKGTWFKTVLICALM